MENKEPSKLEKTIKGITEIAYNSTYRGIFQLILGTGCLYTAIQNKDCHKLDSAILYFCSGASIANGIDNLIKNK